jgi:hypothetical protein
MKDDGFVGDGATDRLAQAIDCVQHDVEMVAFWACAFGGLVRPIPDYEIEGVTVLTSHSPPVIPASASGRKARPRRRDPGSGSANPDRRA